MLAALAVPWRPRAARRWRRRRVFGAASIAVLVVASSPAVANRLEWAAEQRAKSTYRPDSVYDVVIVLGGIGDERIWAATGQRAYNESVERITVAYDLLKADKARFVIVSGGVNDERFRRWNEAVVLRDTLVDWGISADRVLVEDRAMNTRENAVFSAAIVRERGFERVLVVTSAFHVPRAGDCFRAVGLDADFLPVDYRAHEPASGDEWLPRAHALDMTTAMIREWAGRLVYRLRGYGKGA